MTQVGFVGGGNIARTHAEALAPLEVELAAVTDVDPDARAQFETTRGMRTYDDYEGMLADGSVDVTAIAD